MKLNLIRPLCFFDLEATGIDKENDRIVEIAICKIHPSGLRELLTGRVNPEMPIPPKATEIHGISDADVADAHTFSDLAKRILDFISGCDMGGYNSNSYDLPLLFNEFKRVGIYWDYNQFKKIDAGNIFKIKEARTLSAAVKFYCDRDMENAHSAEADILATVDVFFAQLERYDDLPTDLGELELFCNYGKPILDISGKFTTDESGEVVFNFGAKRGVRAKDELGLVQWMINKDFPADTLNICYQILEGEL